MSKPNPSRSIHDLLNNSSNWTLTGDLSLSKVDFIVERRSTPQTNRPTVLIQKGRRFTHEEGLPKGVLTWVVQEVFIQPLMQDASGVNDRMWEMSEEVDRIVRNNRAAASGIERITIAPRSPRSGNLQEPYRGNEVVIQCFWRES